MTDRCICTTNMTFDIEKTRYSCLLLLVAHVAPFNLRGIASRASQTALVLFNFSKVNSFNSRMNAAVDLAKVVPTTTFCPVQSIDFYGSAHGTRSGHKREWSTPRRPLSWTVTLTTLKLKHYRHRCGTCAQLRTSLFIGPLPDCLYHRSNHLHTSWNRCGERTRAVR